MALDRTLVDPILNTYKGFIADLEAKNCTGENYQKLVDAVAYLEKMADEYSGMDGFMDFNARIMNENLYGKMGDYYGRALTEKSDSSGGSTYDDSALLEMSLNALRDAIAFHKKNYEQTLQRAKEKNVAKTADLTREVEMTHRPVMEKIIQSIQAVIDIGEEEGMTYPRFLTLQLERGLFDATATQLGKETFEENLKSAQFLMVNSVEIEEKTEILNAYEQLVSQSALGTPEIAEWNLVYDDICRAYEIPKMKYQKPLEWGLEILEDLSLWSLAYSPNAMNYEPWMLVYDEYQRREAITKDQKTLPGVIKAKIFQLKKYFDIDFATDFFKSEAFLHCVKSNEIRYSQAFVEFLVAEVLPQCVPCRDLTTESATKRDEFYTQHSELNPEGFKPALRQKEHYDQKFGAGAFEEKFGVFDYSSPSPAKPWN